MSDATTPEAEYDGDTVLLHVTLTAEQAGLIVYCVMEQSKQMPVSQQLDWARLALGLNDAITEARNGGAESG